MPIPPPPPPGGPPPPPTVSQAKTSPAKLSREEVKGRGDLLLDICKGTKLRKVSVVNDRSAPLLDKPRRERAAPGGSADSQSRGLFTGVPKPRPVGVSFSGRAPSTRAAAPQPPSHAHGDVESPPPKALLPLEMRHSQHPSLPILNSGPSPSSPSSATSIPSSAPPPPPPLCRRGNASSSPTTSFSYNREKPLPPAPHSTPPLPSKHPHSPGGSTRPPTSGGNTTSSLAPPLSTYRITNGPTASSRETAPELPQRHNSLSNKKPAPSPEGHTPTRGPAPPPPAASPILSQQAAPGSQPAVREGPGRGAVQSASSRVGGREAPPPPPYRIHGSPSISTDPPTRGKPPPPPTRTPSAPPPPPPPLRNGHSFSSTPRSFVDDFESKYLFHSLDDIPPPDEYRQFMKIYPSRANRVMRGAPPLPPVGR